MQSNQVYARSIERLKEHLHTLQQISQKREGLEEKLRQQLQAEIQRLKKGQREKKGMEDGEGGRGGDVGKGEGEGDGGNDEGKEKEVELSASLETQLTMLQADLVKV